MATTSQSNGYLQIGDRQIERFDFVGLDNADTVAAAAPASGFQWVVVGIYIWDASAALNIVVEDDTTPVHTVLEISASTDVPKQLEVEKVWLPMGEAEPLEIRTSTGTASGSVFYKKVAT